MTTAADDDYLDKLFRLEVEKALSTAPQPVDRTTTRFETDPTTVSVTHETKAGNCKGCCSGHVRSVVSFRFCGIGELVLR